MRTRTHALAAAAAVLVLLAATPAGTRIARGFPDPSFDRDGAVQTDFGSFDFGTAVAVQSDGKILATGATEDKVALARYLPSGRLDRSFSKDGKTTVSFEAQAFAGSIAPAPGGRVVIAGTHARYIQDQCCQYGIAVARLTKAGSLDGTFGEGGRVVIEIPSSGRPAGIVGGALAVQADGSVFAGGWLRADPVSSEDEYALDELIPSSTLFPRVERSAFWITKLTPAGEPDPTFGVNGTVITNLDGGNNTLSDLEVARDGSIVAAGRTDADPRPGMLVVRYLPSGELDPLFGPGGFRAIRTGSDRDAGATGLALTRSGAILVSGYATAGLTQQFPDGRAVVVRLRPDGTSDPAFGTGGATRFQLGSSSSAGDIAATPSGGAYLSGTVRDQFGQFFTNRPAVFALTSAGRLVRGFGIGGAGEVPPDILFLGGITLHKGKPLVIGSSIGGTTGQVCANGFCFFAGFPDYDFALVRLRA